MNAKDMETKIIFVFFFNFFQYVWPELIGGHIKIWNSELREMYANVFLPREMYANAFSMSFIRQQ